MRLVTSVIVFLTIAVVCVAFKGPRIEADIQGRTSEALVAEGYLWATVEIHGRDISLVGTAPSAALRASAAAEAAAVWGVRVVDNLLEVAPPQPEPESDREAACLERFTAMADEEVAHFAFDSAELTDEGADHLGRVALLAAQCPLLRLEVEGFADATGTREYNLDLSRRRAEEAARFMRDAGVSAGRLETKALGETHPAASNTTEAGRALNRRAEVRLIGGNR